MNKLCQKFRTIVAQYIPSSDCRDEYYRRNFLRASGILKVLQFFGISCIAYILIENYGSSSYVNSNEFLINLIYYSSYCIIGALFLFVMSFMKKKHVAANYVGYAVIVGFEQLFFWLNCFLWTYLHGNWSYDFSIWILFDLVWILVFTVNPVTFLLATIVEVVCIFVESTVPVQADMGNFLLIMVLVVCYAFIHWRNIIYDFNMRGNILLANEKAHRLLLNVFPNKVVMELQSNGRSDPKLYHAVSIMFTDMIGFTSMVQEMPPEILINELNEIYTGFDKIIIKHECIRIKTIGDAYMAACGLPDSDSNHAQNIIDAALECIDFLNIRNKTASYEWKMRVGVNSGEVIAGIVGTQKYIYDVFGDTVNLASRLQSASDSMQVNIGPETYKIVKNDYDIQARPAKKLKGKGLVKMFFVHTKKNLSEIM